VSDIGAGARPDLIISDYHLADEQTGITAIAKLREVYGVIPAWDDGSALGCAVTADRAFGFVMVLVGDLICRLPWSIRSHT
jgi:hypothetical protein